MSSYFHVCQNTVKISTSMSSNPVNLLYIDIARHKRRPDLYYLMK